jgi:fibronectin type 3 domain-containing protein
MFTRLSAAVLTAAMSLLFCLGATSCGSQSTTGLDSALTGNQDLTAAPGGNDLAAREPSATDACPQLEQGTFATLGLFSGDGDANFGSVTLGIAGTNLVVGINVANGGTLSKTRLYVGSSTPTGYSPSDFPYRHDSLKKATSDAYSLPLSSLHVGAGEHLYIAVITEVSPGGSATAWTPSSRFRFDSENWKSYSEFYLPQCEFANLSPSGVSATYLGNGRIRLEWNPMAGATAYQIWRATAQGGPYSPIGSTDETWFVDTVPAPGSYWYQIRGANGGGVSAFSTAAGSVATSGPAPAAPTNVDGSYANGKVHLTWTASTGAVGYQVFRSGAQTGTYTAIGSTTNLWFDDTVGPGSYWYKVRAVNADNGAGPFTQPFGVVVPQPSPSAPANADGSYDNGKVHLTWDAVAGAVGYQIFRSTTQAGSYGAIGSTTNTFFDDTVAPGSTFWYKIRAVDGNNNQGSFTQPIGVVAPAGLTAPMNVQASDGTYPDHIQISWNSVAGATGYRVYRALSQDGTYTLVASTSQLSLNHTSGNSYVYWYKVSAVDSSAEGPQSAADSGYASVAAPSMVRASDGTFSDRIRVSWMAVSGAVSYKVYRSVSQTGTYQFVGTTTALQLDDFVTDNAVYWYRVTTSAPQGESYRSQEDSGFKQ